MKTKLFICLICCFFCSPSMIASAASDEVRIGVITSLTGGGALWGMQDKIGALMAERDIEKAGGIVIDGKKRKVKVDIEDDETKPTTAVKVLREFANKGIHTCVVMGTKITMSLIGLNEELGIILYTYSTTPELTQKGNKLLLRSYPTQEWLAGLLGYAAAVDLNLKKVALLNTNDDYGNSYKKYFTEVYSSHGGKIVADELFKTGDPDFYSQLTSIKSKNPDGIQLGGFTGDAPVLLRQTREILGDIRLFGCDYYKTDTFKKVGKLAQGFIFTQACIHVIETPEKEAFVKEYTARGGIDPIWGSLGYERVRCYARAMEIAITTTDVKKIRNAMEKAAKEAVTLGGVTEWLPNGDIKSATCGVYRWDADKSTPVLIRKISKLDQLK